MAFGRKRGAQPGNKNAHKHGFYSSALSPKARQILRDAQRVDPTELAQEIALLRARIHQLLAAQPENLTILIMALRQLAHLVAVRYRLSQEQEDGIHDSLHDLIRQLQPAPP